MRINADARLAVIGAGVRWRPVVEAAAAFGLAPVVGSSVTVGAIGYTLGGGLGPLARSHGFSSDWVQGFRVVTATGDVATADAHENPDLFWALRGGKGGFGIVTEVTVELAPLPALYAGGLYFEGTNNIEAALRAWVEWLPDAPENVSTSVALLRLPDEESAPAHLRGRNLLHLRFAFPGDPSEGERLIAPLRAAGLAYLDTVGELPLREVAAIHGDPEAPQPLKSFCAELTGIDQDLVTALLRLVGPEADSPFVEVELRHLGGAAARDTAETTAVGGRDGALMLRQVVENPSLFAAARDVSTDVFGAAVPWRAAVTNVNFAGNTAIPSAFEAASPDAIRSRLAELRAKYDPNRVFPFGPS
ncbi:MAG: FAD-binding oxidoreductase [Trebonia sp.]